MKYRNILLVGLLLIFGGSLFGQNDKKYIREGNKEFANENFEKSELSYRKAVELAKAPFKASFNVGDALYKQEKYEEAAKQFEQLSESEIDKAAKGYMYHNLGNSMLQSSKLEESIEAYKDALRNNPNDLETKYNLAFAQDKLKEQQQQEQQNKDNKDQDQDQNKDQENKDNQDQQNKDQENKENKDKQDQNQDQNKNNQDKQQQQQQQPNQISKEDAARILQALQNQEKDIQDKVKKAKAVKAKVKTTTNW